MCAESVFPPPENADENGIVAVSRTIDTGLLKDAYMHGIFPWPFGEEYDVIPWCAPLERGVLMLEDFHIPRSLVREMKKMDFSLRIDHDFPAVIRGCARALRKEAPGTWITSQVIDAYCEFQKMGYAHSFETYDSQGELVGGLYGISIGRIFCGESMFYKRSGASKFAFVKMADVLKAKGVVLVDTQVVTSVTASFGAVEIPSADYIRLLEKYRGKPLKFRESDASE